MSDKTGYAVLPLRDIVVFPHMIVPLFVGREKSVQALEKVMGLDKKVLLLSQKTAADDNPKEKDLYEIGTVGTVLQLLKLPDGTVKVLVEGLQRAKVKKFVNNDDFFEAEVEFIEEEEGMDESLEALSRAVMTQFEQYVRLNKKIPSEILNSVSQIEDPLRLADTISSHLVLKISEKQDLLETIDITKRLEKIFTFMESEIGVLEVEKKIRGRVKKQMEKTQRDYYLNEQMKAIQQELEGNEEAVDEITEIKSRIEKTKLSKEAKTKALSELKKLKHMSPMSGEASVVRNYLDWILDLPWDSRSKTKKDLDFAQDVLDREHYGLKKVKTRIVEYLAVLQRVKKMRGQVLCLMGPPGVGKSSLGESIARATNREFVRISLGGVRDESEIRGHRRTYVGSMPGKVIQSMKKAGKSNPLFLLDEIDKLGSDWRGDPSSALLEVLDPVQNATFNDHYLEVDYDLSDVMFICTANSYDLPRPLLDRMEIINLSGYTEIEKIEIAKRHLVPKQIELHGLSAEEFKISDNAIRDLIRHYTKEAGVRNLEREISNLARKVTTEIVKKKSESKSITPRNLRKYAGVQKFSFDVKKEESRIGLVNGLAWTSVGGEMLPIETITYITDKGKGKVSMTGKLGDVMKESIQVAEMLVRSKCLSLGILPSDFDKTGIHIHVPEGATPKDGPSAGLAMVTSIVSVLTNIPVRNDVAMTGEVGLLGQALPIGGLKEKLLAALRAGIKTAIIPKENEKDLEELPDNVKKGLEIIPVENIEEVLKVALISKPKPISAEDMEKIAEITSKTAEKSQKDVIHH